MLQILPQRKLLICSSLSHHSKRILILLEKLEGLSEFQKASLIARFISMTEELKRRMIFYSFIFHIGRFIVTGGSLVVPALLSIQTPSGTSEPMFWSTWALSLLVTFSNAILTLFKVEKKYYYIHTCTEHLYSEIWQYIELTGRYSGKLLKGTKETSPTHKNQYIFLCHVIERIKTKQIEEEYFKTQDPTSSSSSSTQVHQTHEDTDDKQPGFGSLSRNVENLAQSRAEMMKQFEAIPNITSGSSSSDAV